MSSDEREMMGQGMGTEDGVVARPVGAGLPGVEPRVETRVSGARDGRAEKPPVGADGDGRGDGGNGGGGDAIQWKIIPIPEGESEDDTVALVLDAVGLGPDGQCDGGNGQRDRREDGGDGHGADGDGADGPRPERSGSPVPTNGDDGDGDGDAAVASPWAGNGCPPGSNRGGGPRTAEGLAACGQAATRHGIYRMLESGMMPGCNICLVKHLCEDAVQDGACVQALRAMDEISTEVMKVGHIAPVAHHVVREYARLVVLLEIMDKHIAMDGLFRREGDTAGVEGPLRPAPLVGERLRISNQVLTYAKELGLTPSAQARAKLGTLADRFGGLQKTFEDFIAEQQQQRGGGQMTLDGEFDEDGVENGGTEGW